MAVINGTSDADYLIGTNENDELYGLESDDVLYGAMGADLLNGGEGDDFIVSADSDMGSQAFGEAGNDTITVVNGRGDGGADNDVLTGTGTGYVLMGGEGDDQLILNLVGQQSSGGFADGGHGDDTYVVNTSGLVTIQDSGDSLNDTLILATIDSANQLNVTRIGNDAYLHSANDGSNGIPGSGVKLAKWYAGGNTIEHIQTADGQVYNLPAAGDAFAMFG